jgi:MFS family permease
VVATVRTRLLVLAAALATIGWGTVLPFQYAYAADARGWGSGVAALAATAFSLGALVAAPLGGRLADRHSPVRVTAVARVVAALAVAGLVLADSPTAFLALMALFGAAATGAVPAQTLLVLRWVGEADRRRVFALVFSAQALSMAAGAWVGGRLVDLSRPTGMTWSFLLAAAGFVASAGLVVALGVGAPAAVRAPVVPEAVGRQPRGAALGVIVRTPALRWVTVVAAALVLGFYAQFESGLPAYALTVLGAQPSDIGLAAAVNCVVIVGLQMGVVRLTARRSSASLLLGVGLVWVAGWVLLSLAHVLPASATMLFVVAYGVFGVGETMYAPILSPLAASLVPEGHLGGVLGILGGLQTGLSALGPLVAGVLLGADLPEAFLGLHVVISVVAVVAALRLRRALRDLTPAKEAAPDRADLAVAA